MIFTLLDWNEKWLWFRKTSKIKMNSQGVGIGQLGHVLFAPLAEARVNPIRRDPFSTAKYRQVSCSFLNRTQI